MTVMRQRYALLPLFLLLLFLILAACDSTPANQSAMHPQSDGRPSGVLHESVPTPVPSRSQGQDTYGVVGSTTVATALNAAAIVFREGLEAVLILASLMGSLKHGEARRLRPPLWGGAAISLLATVLTWMLAASILRALAGFGERLEAVVSLIAIAVLLLITNWFFHKVYWTGWIAGFHNRKGRLVSAEIGQWIGLVALGFSSIYREGFEVVLFSQALVLQAGSVAVVAGVGLGLLGTLLVGLIVFGLQIKLPSKKMLIVTGILIGWVLIILVGNTVDVLQAVGWLPTHQIGTLHSPTWLILASGFFPTWEGMLLQGAAGTFVLGSYILAERQRHRNGQRNNSRAGFTRPVEL